MSHFQEITNVIVELESIDKCLAVYQAAWDQFRALSAWTTRDGRIYDYCGNFVATKEDAPIIHSMIAYEAMPLADRLGIIASEMRK